MDRWEYRRKSYTLTKEFIFSSLLPFPNSLFSRIPHHVGINVDVLWSLVIPAQQAFYSVYTFGHGINHFFCALCETFSSGRVFSDSACNMIFLTDLDPILSASIIILWIERK
jgi:hypothetical protein